MRNINALSLILQKIWARLKFLWQIDRQTNGRTVRKTDRRISFNFPRFRERQGTKRQLEWQESNKCMCRQQYMYRYISMLLWPFGLKEYFVKGRWSFAVHVLWSVYHIKVKRSWLIKYKKKKTVGKTGPGGKQNILYLVMLKLPDKI